MLLAYSKQPATFVPKEKKEREKETWRDGGMEGRRKEGREGKGGNNNLYTFVIFQ